MSAARYWHTVRHLRLQQVVGRLRHRLPRPAPDLRPAPVPRVPARAWHIQTWREPSLTGADTVTFLGEAGVVRHDADWNDPSHARLWTYNLHYFDDLTSKGFAGRRPWHEAWLDRWMRDNRPGHGAGWEPYPTSLRLANWIKWLSAGARPSTGLRDRLMQSLAVQARWLVPRLEVHIQGNHLWSNAKALLMAGVFFAGPEAEAWRRRGLALVGAELGEQILPDGGHFERSPMYHALVLEDVLDLIQLSAVFPGGMPPATEDRLRSVAVRMLRWLRVMTHPDGEVSFFNDAAFGIAAPYGALASYAAALDVPIDDAPLHPVEALPDSGYLRLENNRATVWCDVAPVGPDHQPGHAHADTLAFELSLDGRRVIVNAGTSTYVPGPERDRQRSTAAHNTVEVDGVNSSDVWAGFRVARRARPFDVRSGTSGDRRWAEGAHDGYRHRPGGVIHRRTWSLDPEGLTVTDRLDGRFGRAIARFLLHPDAARSPDLVKVQTVPPRPVTRAAATWHPRFGSAVDTRVIEIDVARPETITRVSWS